MDGFVSAIVDGLGRYFGQTVTIFTTSGGISGSGFTGVLVFCDCNVVKLITDIGAAPACPLGSCCTGPIGGCGFGGGWGWGGSFDGGGGRFSCGCGCNALGSIVTIPTRAIAAFTHNTI